MWSASSEIPAPSPSEVVLSRRTPPPIGCWAPSGRCVRSGCAAPGLCMGREEVKVSVTRDGNRGNIMRAFETRTGYHVNKGAWGEAGRTDGLQTFGRKT